MSAKTSLHPAPKPEPAREAKTVAGAFELKALPYGSIASQALATASRHTGVPALVVAAAAVVLGYRVLKRSARFAVEVAVVVAVLAGASYAGWLRF